ncbi:MAG TPA: AAA family ATPase [Patescibacteria group bacterium]|jgi:ATP-dependent Clp protease ATP-binding subunit ClpA|nr:AAA family ATPase [Patescibacteria group bacterium]
MYQEATVKQLVRKPILDPGRKSQRAVEFEEKLLSKVIGQDRAVRHMARIFQTYLGRMNNPNRPLDTILFMGPTGSGKTKTVEAAAEILFPDQKAVIKIDCGEFQSDHDIAKLIGSPPGYLGHRETSPIFTQDNLDKCHDDDTKLTFVLFDEIEKADDTLCKLMLGILDKATLTLGDNRKVDFSKSIIIMTSNLGAREMSELISGGIGFAPAKSVKEELLLRQQIYHTALSAAKRKFSPEFMNRIDKVVVFHSLTEQHLRKILDLELMDVQNRIIESKSKSKFIFQCEDDFRDFLFREGLDTQYGARHIKRVIEKALVLPLSNLVATEQVETGDIVKVTFNEELGKGAFHRLPGAAIVPPPEPEESVVGTIQPSPYDNYVAWTGGQ